jgi:hypothetical protein
MIELTGVEKEDVSSYRMTLRKGKDTVIERGNTKSHCVENWLGTCRKADCLMNVFHTEIYSTAVM